ncbi:bifunctional DNA primase/polymerase-like protein [Streptomyces sp. 1114.5]|uniref:bifunctional DNA primase/polymerase n=1 Tax=Streptomyces sp. 1114.5 TaxID=1938830 RepID=UPI000F122F33|nr:bifunctional DNA primase/polymerase [Streptomyces sp. 1114.5]RKT09526.1 bifunctional DNA primase/polymerase-like protein [Streptomyces sp. 1114.5]
MTAPQAVGSDRTSRQPDMPAVARWCAAQGWPVHPLAPGRKTPPANCQACQESPHSPAECPCTRVGRWCHGFHAATVDQDVINAWWTVNPDFGTGVACGPAGLVVIDIDSHPGDVPARDRLLPGIPIHEHVNLDGLENGYHTLALLAALRSSPDPAQDTSTLRIRTPSGGMHVWYRDDADLRFTCSTGSSTGRALAWQVDVRAHGGYIVAPGTTTSAGTYTALPGAWMPAPLPRWLSEELVRTGHLKDRPETRPTAQPPVPDRARQAVVAAGGGKRGAERILDTVLQDVTDCATTPEGAGFTGKLNRAAYTVGGLVSAGHLTHGDAEQLLLDAARTARPTQDRHSSAVIRSGLAAGARQPLHIGKARG